jgi:DNA-binding transcriptional MerR regulator
LKERIGRKVLFAKDILKMFPLSYRQLNEWEKRGICLGDRKNQCWGSWRKYSIKDSISFAIILMLRDTGIPLAQSQRVIRSLQGSDIIENATIQFLNGERVVLYFRLEDRYCNLLTPDKKKTFMKDILTSNTPTIVLPLNSILSYVLPRSDGGDVPVVRRLTGTYRKLT